MALNATSPAGPDLPPHFIEIATAAADWLLIWPVALPLLGAGFLVMLRGQDRLQAVFAALVTLAVVVSDATLFARVMEEGPVAMTMGRWLPPFGITFAADAFGVMFSLAGTVIVLIAIVFAVIEIDGPQRRYGFYPLLLLLLAGVNGSFLTGDVFNLYVWFEVMLIASFGLLIMGGRKIQLDGAMKYGFLNFLATTMFLVAIAFTYGLTGTLNMADLYEKAGQAPLPAMVTVGALYVVALGVKAAAFPGHSWLPASYHTPAVVVSAVFGGLLTKVGGYALIRVFTVIMPSIWVLLTPALSVLAVATLILAPFGALAETNLRRAIGFFVIGGIGMVLAGLALGNAAGLAGAAVYAVHSMFTCAALYMGAGLVERMTGTTDIRQMGGVYAQSPLLSIAFIILVFAISGMPPFLGMWGKILLVKGGIEGSQWVIVAAILINALLTILAASRLWAHVFWRSGPEGEASERPHPAIRALTGPERGLGLGALGVLVVLIAGLGLFPEGVMETGRVAAADLIDPQRYLQAVFALVPQP